ncbi:uncharacterized protein NPIL_393181 [Nephila pilipes]|uniref:Uncharacterized protein n=1 Tax=Nephila pilipes TaxID=299642 RepID=A0A8X6UJB3_NEPPI|nr:uncharacterized protein NPIL_393181 [Nephila pilipes]
MNFVLSLEHIALVKVAVTIYNHPDFRDILRNCNRHLCEGLCCLDKREQFIKKKIPYYTLPVVLLPNLLSVIQSLHCEFQAWEDFHSSNFGYDFSQLNNICWNFLGAIDYEETAKRLVHSEDFILSQRFSVACCYWLTNDVLRLWNGASTSQKETVIEIIQFRHHRRYSSSPLFVSQAEKQWIKWLEEGAAREKHFSYVGLLTYLPDVTPPSIEIWQQLTPIAVKRLQRRLLRNHWNTSIGRDYFSRMDANLRMEVFKDEPTCALALFLYWPLQTEFLEMFSQLHSFINADNFLRLLRLINSGKYYDYTNLRRKFWLQCPDHLKKDVEMYLRNNTLTQSS